MNHYSETLTARRNPTGLRHCLTMPEEDDLEYTRSLDEAGNQAAKLLWDLR